MENLIRKVEIANPFQSVNDAAASRAAAIALIESRAARAPESRYRHAVDKSERRRLRTEVLEAYRGHVRSYVRKQLSVQHWEEAEQVGLIGLWYALEKYHADEPFWPFAEGYVNAELTKWTERTPVPA